MVRRVKQIPFWDKKGGPILIVMAIFIALIIFSQIPSSYTGSDSEIERKLVTVLKWLIAATLRFL
ncbi:MAG: hypothetical protein O3A36_03925 [bacterium]|nr:hypothetical protein [bacterium]